MKGEWEMRRRFAVAAAALALSAALTVPAYAGTWKYVNDQWKYQKGTNKFAYNEWIKDNGKYYYINDDGVIWNPGTMPSGTPVDSYECRHGLGYSRFCSSKNQLQAELLAFVPVDAACEINCLKLQNNSSSVKNISLFSYVEFCLWNAMDDMTNFQRNLSIGEVEIEGSTIYHKTEYRERRRHYSFFSVNTRVQGMDTSRDAFLGLGQGNAFPEAVRKKKTRARSSGLFL